MISFPAGCGLDHDRFSCFQCQQVILIWLSDFYVRMPINADPSQIFRMRLSSPRWITCRNGMVAMLSPIGDSSFGAVHIEIVGIASASSILDLAGRIACAHIRIPSAVINLDRAVLIADPGESLGLMPFVTVAPAAIVMKIGSYYTRGVVVDAMVNSRVMRAVFAPHHASYARTWAESHARANAQE
jgi:hypothetical protein